MIRAMRFLVVLGICALLMQLPVLADPVTANAGITLDFLDGNHESGAGIARITFIPLPLVDADARYRHTALHVEGLPSVTFSYGSKSLEGASATRLSILNTSIRQYLGGSFFIGVGQTVYNQRTSYDVASQTTRLRTVGQESRVTGLRFEAGLNEAISSSTHLRATLAVNPVMHGVQYSTVATVRRNCTVINDPAFAACPTSELTDPERSSQFDISISLAKQLRRGELIYGVRYLDYVAHYSEIGQPGDGLLADRNVGIMPLIGYRVKL
jgi:hypothetical protein